jgi:hypothetical protein
MPVIVTTSPDVDLWLLVDAPKAFELERRVPAMRCDRRERREGGWPARRRGACPKSRTNAFALTVPGRLLPTRLRIGRHYYTKGGSFIVSSDRARRPDTDEG